MVPDIQSQTFTQRVVPMCVGVRWWGAGRGRGETGHAASLVGWYLPPVLVGQQLQKQGVCSEVSNVIKHQPNPFCNTVSISAGLNRDIFPR